jgi:hypothetical protein
MTSRARSEHLVRASASSMMRKLSVASITSNFTKRSGSIASLHRAAAEEALADGEMQKTSPPRAEHSSSESIKPGEIDEMAWSRLSVIQDEKENVLTNSFENLSNMKFGPNGSPAGTMHRLATLKVKKSWAHDGQRIITPPLRTSSANSLNQNRAVTPLSMWQTKRRRMWYKRSRVNQQPHPRSTVRRVKGLEKTDRWLQKAFVTSFVENLRFGGLD